MALKAGYVGVKKNDAIKLSQLPGISDIGTGLQLEDGELSATGATKTIEGNPEGSATETLTKLQIGDDIFSIPGNDNTKCYQTDDTTESAIVDADYVPFFDSSAASGAGAPRKSTWTNFISKIQAKLNGVFFPRSEQAVLGAKNLLPNNASNKTDGNVAWVVNADKSITINTSAAASSVQTLSIGEVTGLQGDYILNGVTGGNSGTYGIQLYDVTTSTWITQYSVDGDSTINLADKTHTYRFVAYVRQDVTVSDITIYPMLRFASDPDPTYVPYAMTNKELTELNTIKDITSNLTALVGSLAQTNNYLFKEGKKIIGVVRLTGVTANSYTSIARITGTGGLPNNAEFFCMGKIVGGNYVGFRWVNKTNGVELECTENLSDKEVMIYDFTLVTNV